MSQTERKFIDELSYLRGFRDGTDGYMPMCPAIEYLEGFRAGRCMRLIVEAALTTASTPGLPVSRCRW